MTPRFIAAQLSRPSGFLGRIIMRLMNWHNAGLNAYTLQQLAVGSQDRVLEIGFGGGLTLAQLIESGGFVAGVDRSPDVVQRAMKKHAKHVRSGRADFREGNVEALPFEAASFSRVCTVNTVYFWKSLETGFAEIRRVLAPGGRVAVGFLPKESMDRMGLPADIFTMRTPDHVVAAISNAGFRDVRVTRPKASTPWNVIVAEK
jgi:SAM-dependent methyltransferase